MRVRALALPVVAALVLCACASLRARTTTESEVLVGPGGRAEGRFGLDAGAVTRIELRNEGLGRADFAIRAPDGHVLAHGALGEADVKLALDAPGSVTVVVEAYRDAGTKVAYEVTTRGGLAIDWDLSRAFPPADAK